MNKLLAAFALLLLGLGNAAAAPISEFDTDLRAERDTLLGKIARGEDSEKNVARFSELFKEYQKRKQVAAGQDATEKDQKRSVKEQQEGLDSVVGEKCELAADPRAFYSGHRSAFMHADWGRVTVKQPVRIPGRRPFDEEEQITLYKIAGQTATYVVSSKGPALWYGTPLQANVGDLILLCIVSRHSEGSGSSYPPEFRENIISQGFTTPIKEPPLIAQKQQRNPVHILGTSSFAHAILTGDWRHPKEQAVLNRMLVKQDLGVVGSVHRYAIFVNDKEEFLLEVPPSVKNTELLKPYRYAWVMMSQPRFDRELKRLVFTAEEIDARYVTPAR